jgi:amidase
MATGQLASTALTEAYLDRIRAVDLKVHAVLFLDPTARRQAEVSGRRRREHRLLGPLDGIPVLLKDNIDTRTMPTTAGSRALLGANPGQDATLVRRLRAAGELRVRPRPLPGDPGSAGRRTIRMCWPGIRAGLRQVPPSR